jgi:hypothetical protein
MILFVPAYDEATRSNLTIAKMISQPQMITLFAKDATPEKFAGALQEQTHWPVFAMSHGTPDSLKAQEGQTALSTAQVELLGRRVCYVFACHTATQLGPQAAKIGSSWWGYVGTVSGAFGESKAPETFHTDDSSAIHSLFVEIFIFLRDQFHLEMTVLKRQQVLVELQQKCEQAANLLDKQYLAFPQQSFLEEYVTLAHLWERLRIWVSGNEQAEKHPSASEPVFDWF